MPRPYESAKLNFKLFELRRQSVWREARAWFRVDFNPEKFTALVSFASGGRNAAFRVVLGDWDMAASLVTAGAIDGDPFRAAHGEIFATFSKIQPFLGEWRKASGEPDDCKHMETVVVAAKDAAGILSRRREAMPGVAKAGVQQAN